MCEVRNSSNCRLYCPARKGLRCPGAAVCQGSDVLVAVPDPDSPDGLRIIGAVRGRQTLVELLVSLQPDEKSDQ